MPYSMLPHAILWWCDHAQKFKLHFVIFVVECRGKKIFLPMFVETGGLKACLNKASWQKLAPGVDVLHWGENWCWLLITTWRDVCCWCLMTSLGLGFLSCLSLVLEGQHLSFLLNKIQLPLSNFGLNGLVALHSRNKWQLVGARSRRNTWKRYWIFICKPVNLFVGPVCPRIPSEGWTQSSERFNCPISNNVATLADV